MISSRLLRAKNRVPKRLFGTTNKDETDRNNKYLAATYDVCDSVISKANGIYVEDVEGHKMLDFHSGYSCTNQGHLHPKILQALYDQTKKLTMASRIFNTDISGEFAQFISETFGYEKMVPMNSGSEACECAVKMARRWGVMSKGIDNDKVTVITTHNCFWGRTIVSMSGCSDPNRYSNFGPLVPGFDMVPFNDPDALEEKLKENPNICAFMIEPIQGAAGVIVPDDDYLRRVQALCRKYNVLFICDEVQAGLGRTGYMLAHQFEEGVRPDIVTLAKATTGGVLPLSLALADSHIIDLLGKGQHGTTYGGNALGCAVAKAAIEVIIEEDLCERSRVNGAFFHNLLESLDTPVIKLVRGRGLWYSLVIDRPGQAKEFSEVLAKNGLACRNTDGESLRFAPPLTIEREQLEQAAEIILKTCKEFE
ncbi:unnamed protein product [Moneuplotes crassus]|uniref:Ornithine aminotransferase n=2 Tax=Euplotes crassus TaxID=5936 RepID=A0AAD1XFS3_EUPCR|nr:unnamed protein product [Moneuplotes crassus]